MVVNKSRISNLLIKSKLFKDKKMKSLSVLSLILLVLVSTSGQMLYNQNTEVLIKTKILKAVEDMINKNLVKCTLFSSQIQNLLAVQKVKNCMNSSNIKEKNTFARNEKTEQKKPVERNGWNLKDDLRFIHKLRF